MRSVVQRVSEASVAVDGQIVGRIERGSLVLLGVEAGDDESDIAWTIRKLAGLRIFPDSAGAMNLDAAAAGAAFLIVSQFTLLGDARKGNRPSFIAAAPPEEAERACEAVVEGLRAAGFEVATGRFRAMMQVRLVNEGPVTIILDSRRDDRLQARETHG